MVGLVLEAMAYALMPKSKAAKPALAQQMDSPTASAGKPIPVVFGTMGITEPNVLWFGDKQRVSRKVKVKGAK